VGSDAPEYYSQLVEWLEEEPSVRFAFQPGTFQITLGACALADLYRRADLLVCNREEAAEIGGATSTTRQISLCASTHWVHARS